MAINRSRGLCPILKLKKSQWLKDSGQRADWEYTKDILKSSFIFGLSKLSWVFSAADICPLEKVVFWWEASSL